MRRMVAVIGLAVVLLLTGCSGSGIAELDREQVDSDILELPARYEESAVIQESIRWLAEHEGVDFYAARSDLGACLILVRDGDPDDSMAGCSQTELKIEGGGFPTARLYIDRPPPSAPDGMTQLTPNLYISG